MSHFDITNLEKQLKEYEQQTLQEGFWNDSKNSSIILQKIKTLKSKVENYSKLKNELENLKEMSELVIQENDENLVKDILNSTASIKEQLDNLEIQTLLSGKYDINNAIVTIHPGAGGTESQDWAEMLYRMYTRWATKNEYEVKELDYLEGEEAGIKSVIIPSANLSDIEEVDDAVKANIKFNYAETIEQVLDNALDFSQAPKPNILNIPNADVSREHSVISS